MLVEVVELRATGMVLTPEEVSAAKRHIGNLTVTSDGVAYLHAGEHHARDHILQPMVEVQIKAVKGDDFMLRGRQYVAYGKTSAMNPQAWWCRNLRGDHIPATVQQMHRYSGGDSQA
jgi:hypothetical protein